MGDTMGKKKWPGGGGGELLLDNPEKQQIGSAGQVDIPIEKGR